jgi:hypothetical protein
LVLEGHQILLGLTLVNILHFLIIKQAAVVKDVLGIMQKFLQTMTHQAQAAGVEQQMLLGQLGFLVALEMFLH